MAPRPSASTVGSNMQTAYSLTLLSEYTHTLDSLPLDLSRNFADLRELDAVLSSSMASVTAKITDLTKLIEENGPKEERLRLLIKIAEEATHLKPGSDDKIRVACHAADNLRLHASYLTDLLDPIPNFDPLIMNRKTTYPHIATRSYMPTTGLDTGRRRRGAVSNLLVANTDAPAAKKRKGAREEDAEPGNKSPRKEKTVEATNARSRGGARAKKNERAPSPTESLISVASHIPHHAQQAGQNHAKSNANNNSTRNGGASNKRGRNHAGTPDNGYIYDTTTSRKDIYNAPPSSSASHPSLPQPYANGTRAHDVLTRMNGSEWSPGQLEGPGMPVARGQSNPALAMAANTANLALSVPAVAALGTGNVTDLMDDGAEVDGDDKTYCFCDRASFGEMIACDGPQCEKEWFHLPCIGLEAVPSGSWFCETCIAKRDGRRGGRGGRRRAGGNRAGGRAGANA